MLYSWADSKKKSNLVLSVFSPGVEIPWLGNLKRLMPSAEMQDNPYKLDREVEESPFPVETSRRRSYHSQASVVWIKGSGLQVMPNSGNKYLCAILCFTLLRQTILPIKKNIFIFLVV
jgi:hypothetical protein